MFDFQWVLYDRKLKRDILTVDSYIDYESFSEGYLDQIDENEISEESVEKMMFYELALQKRRLKPFLIKYSLILRLEEKFTGCCEPVNLPNVSKFDKTDLTKVEVEILPTKSFLIDKNFFEKRPYFIYNSSELLYPNCWIYNRELIVENLKLVDNLKNDLTEITEEIEQLKARVTAIDARRLENLSFYECQSLKAEKGELLFDIDSLIWDISRIRRDISERI